MIKMQIFCFLLTISTCLAQTTVNLEIAQGSLMGLVRADRKDGVFYSFQSIPFAQPPIGALRFKDPVAAGDWEGTLDATIDLPQCYQRDAGGNIVGQEDCLYLDVYTPLEPANEYDSYKDVMVFIYGGAFSGNSGSEDLFNPEFLMAGDIVLVTLNYRLGLFGSFNLEDTSLEYSGNLGLKDQSLALAWVKDNIARFGGNADSITIFGESAGGASVHYHVLSPLSAGTFHKAIIQSGTAISPWNEGIKNNGILLAEALSIDTGNTTEMIIELLAADAEAISNAQEMLAGDNLGSINFPIIEEEVDGAFITEDPLSIIQSGNYNNVTIMVGYNDAEGIQFHYLYTNLSDFLPGDLDLDSDQADELIEEIKAFYFDGEEPSFENDTNALIQMYTDLWFSYPAYRLAIEHKETMSNSIFFYRFSADTGVNVYKLSNGTTATFTGAAHADELGYLFKTYYHDEFIPNIAPDSVEDLAIDRLVTLWTNFAKYGNPTPEDFTDFEWLPVEDDAFNYVDFGSNATVTGVDPDTSNIQFWSDVYEKYTSAGLSIRGSFLLIITVSIVYFKLNI